MSIPTGFGPKRGTTEPSALIPSSNSSLHVPTNSSFNQLTRASEKPGAVARHEGDAAAAIADAARKVEAIYEQPFLAHATMEPMNCTVQMTSDGCDIWVGTQVQGTTQAAVMKLTGHPTRAACPAP
jgi:isoquinoline 1-oxidoreductase beta subunit